MEHWIAPGAAFILGWTLRPLVQTQEVKVAPCNCLCTCECVSREQHSGLGLILLGFLLVARVDVWRGWLFDLSIEGYWSVAV